MKLRDDCPLKFCQCLRRTIHPDSLQFRLMIGVMIILMMGWTGFTLGTIATIAKLLLSVTEQNNLAAEDALMLKFVQEMVTTSILSFSVTVALSSIFIWRSLLAWQQIEQWVVASATEFNPFPPPLARLPRELKVLVCHWQKVLNQMAGVREQQRQFLNNLAHELRTPLSMIYAYLQRTQQQSHHLKVSQQEALAMAVAEAEQMKQLLQNLLELVRADSQTIPWPMQPLIINDLAIAVAEMIAKFEHRTIKVNITPVPLQVKADPERLRQVFCHLLNNALQYSDVSQPVNLDISHLHHQWVLIEVSDRGYGILPSEQSRIFDPFYRVEASRARSTGGAGLGLSLAKGIVETMGGSISVRSEPGKGSTFTVTLPLLGAKP